MAALKPVPLKNPPKDIRNLADRIEARLDVRFPRHEPGIALRIVAEAETRTLRIAWALAVIEQESGYRNVWGGDRRPDGKVSGIPERLVRQPVTMRDYLAYRVRRAAGAGMQGCGPAQLTWFEFQNMADKAGGCWKVGPNIAVGLHLMRERINDQKQPGQSWDLAWMRALAIYNAGSVDSVKGKQYASEVSAKRDRWQQELFG